MDNGPRNSETDPPQSRSVDGGSDRLTPTDRRAQDRPVGMGLGRVLSLFGCGALVLGVLALVVCPVCGFVFVLELLYPPANFTNTLMVIGAVVVGIGALIALLWLLAQKSAGGTVDRGTFVRTMAVGLICVALVAWSLIDPVITGSHGSRLGQFAKLHPAVTGLNPSAIAVDAQRNLYVLDIGSRNRIVKVSPAGMTLRAIPADISAFPVSSGAQFFISPGGQPYIAELALPSVVSRVPFSGRPESAWTASTPDSVVEQVFDSTLAMDSRGFIYLGGYRSSDSGAQYPIVQKYTSSGKFVQFWQGAIKDATDAGMAVDRSGNVYLGDQAGNRLQSFTASGKIRWTWSRTTDYSGIGVSEPPGVALDRAGNAYIVGSATYLVEKISPNGRRLSAWPVPGDIGSFAMPTGIAVDRQGSVYVVNTASRIFKYSATGKPLAIWK